MPSLYNDIVALVDAALGQAGAVKPVFTTETDPTTYVRNANCFAYGWRNALTCRAVYQNALAGTAGRQMGPTLIAEAGGDNRFAISAHHYHPGVGSTVYFLGTDGVVRNYTVAATQQVAGTDIEVQMLSGVPANVTPAKIWPAGAQRYLPQGAYGTYSLPCVTIKSDNTTAEMRAVIHDVMGVESIISAANATESQRTAFTESMMGGASGSPLFAVMPDGSMVLLTTWNSDTGGPALSGNASGIAAAMTAMAGASRSPSIMDMSGYDAYTLPEVQFSANPTLHAPGTAVTLTWSVTGASSISIDQGIGSVAASGTTTVYPTANTTYTLSAISAGGTSLVRQNVAISALTSFTYYWRGNVSGDVSNAANYATTVGGTTAPAQINPGDIVNKATTVTNAPASGTSYATWSYTNTINGGTYYGPFTVAGGAIAGGTFNGGVIISGGILGGTFNGNVTASTGAIQSGTFNGDVSVVITGSGNPAVLIGGGGAAPIPVFNGRLSINNGSTWMDSESTLPAANQVLAGVAIGRGGLKGTLGKLMGGPAGLF